MMFKNLTKPFTRLWLPHKQLYTFTVVNSIFKSRGDNLKTSNFVDYSCLSNEKFLKLNLANDAQGKIKNGPNYFGLDQIAREAEKLGNILVETKNLKPGQKVAFFAQNSIFSTISTLGIWLAGGVAVPLSDKYPDSDILYFLQDSGAKVFLFNNSYSERAGGISLQMLANDHNVGSEFLIHQVDDVFDVSRVDGDDDQSPRFNPTSFPTLKEEHPALIIYTSGTTGRPKGALHSHPALSAQINMLLEAWEWSEKDSILHCLPLHHVHGLINALLCPLCVGADIHMLPGYKSPEQIWKGLFEIESVNTFMAVPTIYSRLVNSPPLSGPENDFSKFRLLVSGSAALPNPVFEKFKEISNGWELLERYGMTEFCMGISNQLREKRQAGYVGLELPGVKVRIESSKDGSIFYETGQGAHDTTAEFLGVEPKAGTKKKKIDPVVYETGLGPIDSKAEFIGSVSGNLLIKSPGMFQEYLNKPEATKETFDKDGWFITGDVAEFDGTGFKILGRSSTDIIKSGGYKISALQIEAKILEKNGHFVNEVAVIGVDDQDLGEKIVAIVVVDDKENSSLLDFSNLVAYQRPRNVIYSDEPLSRNVMGKLNKKLIKSGFGF